MTTLIVARLQIHVKLWLVPCSSVRPGRTDDLFALAGRTARTDKKHCTTSFFHPGRASGPGIQCTLAVSPKITPRCPGRASGPCVRAVCTELKLCTIITVLHHISWVTRTHQFLSPSYGLIRLSRLVNCIRFPRYCSPFLLQCYILEFLPRSEMFVSVVLTPVDLLTSDIFINRNKSKN